MIQRMILNWYESTFVYYLLLNIYFMILISFSLFPIFQLNIVIKVTDLIMLFLKSFDTPDQSLSPDPTPSSPALSHSSSSSLQSSSLLSSSFQSTPLRCTPNHANIMHGGPLTNSATITSFNNTNPLISKTPSKFTSFTPSASPSIQIQTQVDHSPAPFSRNITLAASPLGTPPLQQQQQQQLSRLFSKVKENEKSTSQSCLFTNNTN